MVKSVKNPSVDKFISNSKMWKKEMEALRKIALDSGLVEDFKWGKPCYSFDGNNILILQGFKSECRMMFFKGVLLKDPKHILDSQGENTQSAKVVRFKEPQDILKLRPTLEKYIKEAIEIEKAGLKVKLKSTADHEVVEEFQLAMRKNSKLKTAFNSLTPGRQRAYLMHFSSAKQPKTRTTRIEKCVPLILAGKGLNDV